VVEAVDEGEEVEVNVEREGAARKDQVFAAVVAVDGVTRRRRTWATRRAVVTFRRREKTRSLFSSFLLLFLLA
jgi:hypothetical protein